MDNLFADEIEDSQDKQKCTGLVFRFLVNNFVSGDGITMKKSFKLLKRKSCNCSKCQNLLDCFYEDIACGYLPAYDGLSHNDLCTLRCSVISRDFETGYADEWEMVFSKI